MISFAGPVNLRDNLYLKIEENSGNVRVNLSQGSLPYPEPGPSDFVWSKGPLVMSGPDITLTYSTITFSTVKRAHAGRYTVFTATFFDPRLSHKDQLGGDYGNLILDVLCELMCMCIIIKVHSKLLEEHKLN